MTLKIICVAGARPNFMKIAPVIRALQATGAFEICLVHTGQHYDAALSRIFFDELEIPRPQRELEVGSGSHAQQTAEILRRFEPVLEAEQPHIVLVVGDVNSTIACTLAAAKFHLQRCFTAFGMERTRPVLVHVEAGLRSFDRDMPEEINRLLTDAISDLLYVSDPAGVEHLRREGVQEERIIYVGNVMIDTLLAAKASAMQSDVLTRLGLREREFGLVTLHRPSNVDDPQMLAHLVGILSEIAQQVPLVFPVHPRTRARLAAAKLELVPPHWLVTEPFGYLDFLKLTATARVVLTDSGGIQEETTVLGVPCLTLRENTERPVTISEGTNQLVGTDAERIRRGFAHALQGHVAAKMPRFWDGRSAQRIAEHLLSIVATGA